LDVLSTKAEELGQISPAACCEELIGKHRGMLVDCTALLSDLDPGKMSPELLDKMANRMIEQALDSNPRAIAEAQRGSSKLAKRRRSRIACVWWRRSREMSSWVVLEYCLSLALSIRVGYQNKTVLFA
jgi:hypothetical protein